MYEAIEWSGARSQPGDLGFHQGLGEHPARLEHHRETIIEVHVTALRDGLALILSETVVPLVVGLLLGGLLAITMTSGASSLLFGLSPRDPVTLAEAAGVLAAIGLLASALLAVKRVAHRCDGRASIRVKRLRWLLTHEGGRQVHSITYWRASVALSTLSSNTPLPSMSYSAWPPAIVKVLPFKVKSN